MSAVRRTEGRAQVRKAHSSPYARPQNSGWSLRKLLEPIRRHVFGQSTQRDDERRNSQISRSTSPADLTLPDEPSYINVLDSESETAEPPRSPTVSPKRPAPVEGLSPQATLENVLDFLTDVTGTSLKREEAHTLVNMIHKGIPGEQTVSNSLLQSVGKPLGAIEVEGMISLVRKQMPYERSEPFRFQSATPSRDNSPFSSAATGTPGVTPKKMLSKNPNGTYRWQGAGSAKQTPRRNRYASPAFGTPKLSPEKTFNLGESTKVDGKRRKVDEEKSTFFASPSTTITVPEHPSSQQKLPFPLSSSQNSRSNGVPPPKVVIPATPTTPSRLRTPTILKPTTPSHPSPLRQAWTGSPNTSQEDLTKCDQPPQDITPPKPSQAASFMSELIKEATPPKKPDLSNPYQTASPLAKVGPPRRSTRRKASRPSGLETQDAEVSTTAKGNEKEKEKLEEKLKEYPPEAIFEATLPKGSKRSRPPTHLEKPAKSDASRSPSPSTSDRSSQNHDMYVVDEDDRSTKKQKGVIESASTLTDLEIEEVGDGHLLPSHDPVSSSNTFGGGVPSTNSVNGFGSSSRSGFGGFKPTTAPTRPSKLRYSYQPDGSTPSSPTSRPGAEPASGSMDLDAPPPPTILSSFSSLPPVPPATSIFAPAPATIPTEPRQNVSKMFKIPLDPKAQALAANISYLPTYKFTMSPKSTPETDIALRETVKSKPLPSLPTFDFSREALKAGPSNPPPSTTLATNGFNWSAAGLKPPASVGSKWNCPSCMLDNPDSAKDQCTVCEAPRPGAVPEAPKYGGFNWGAAGIKPRAPAGSKWKCPSCMLENPDSAKEKCTICEAPRPGAPPAPPPTGFNWGAAGIKLPITTVTKWNCSSCMLENPDSSKEKCTICEAPRPGAAPAAAPKAFDWGAAGIKPPTAASGSTWTCSTCMLSNPSFASQCTVCDTAR